MNRTLRDVAGAEFTSKCFRAWAATNAAADLLRKTGLPETNDWLEGRFATGLGRIARSRPRVINGLNADESLVLRWLKAGA